jgi:7,8-dihydropterin-6-yl-methyl-4-(beta-D-ribofuranosyl)aminobenzene 5'-phosphate synthase
MSDKPRGRGSNISRRKFLTGLIGAGVLTGATPLAARILYESDVNRDGAVTAADAIRALQASSGLVEKRRSYVDSFMERDYTNRILVLYEDSVNLSPPHVFKPISERIAFGKMSIQGISLFTCFNGLRVLLDTTTDVPILKNNTRVAGIDPKSIDVLVLSHVHFDHINAYKFLLTENPEIRIFGPMTKEWMIDNQPRMNPTVDEHTLKNFETVQGDCHPSPMRIIDRAKQVTGIDSIHLLVGGTSLVWLSESFIAYFLECMAEAGVQRVAPCHTTGDVALRLFDEMWGDDHIRTVTDTVIDIPVLAQLGELSARG